MAAKTIRMSLDLTPQMKATIDDLAARRGVTRSTVLRSAIALLKVATEARERGDELCLTDGAGRLLTRLVTF